MTNRPQREYYLDWIRICIVLILIPFHSAVTFSHIGKGYIYTQVPIDSPVFLFISDFFNLWFMRTLFFISGISAFLALGKRTPREFIQERIKRLLIPTLFCLISVAPLSGYLLAISQYGFSGSFFQFYPFFFIELKKYLFWGHMWFCVYLFIFSITTLPLCSFLIKRSGIGRKINLYLIQSHHLFTPILLIIFLEAVLRPFFPGYQSFFGDWANVCVHLSFYLLGFIMGGSKGIFERISRMRFLFFLGALACTAPYILFKRLLILEESYVLSVFLSALWGGAAYCWTFCVLGYSKKYMNNKNAQLAFLSSSSFSLYVFHYLIVSLWNFYLLKTNWSPIYIWCLSIVGTFLSFFLLFEFILKKNPFFRSLLGIKLPKPR